MEFDDDNTRHPRQDYALWERHSVPKLAPSKQGPGDVILQDQVVPGNLTSCARSLLPNANNQQCGAPVDAIGHLPPQGV